MTTKPEPKTPTERAHELLRHLLKVGQKAYESQECFYMMAFPLQVTPENIGMAPLLIEWDDRDELERKVFEIHSSLEHNKCNGLVWVIDSWMTEVPDGMSIEEAHRKGRSGEIKRKEALVASIAGKDIIPMCITVPYTRVGKKLEWGEAIESPHAQSWMMPAEWLLPEVGGSA